MSKTGYIAPPLPKTPAQKTFDWLKNPRENPPPQDAPQLKIKPATPKVSTGEVIGAVGAAGRLAKKMEKPPPNAPPKPKKSLLKKIIDGAETVVDIVTIGGIAYKIVKGIASLLDTNTGKVVRKKVHLYHNPGKPHHRYPVNPRYKPIGARTGI